jgi:hypothetical protein
MVAKPGKMTVCELKQLQDDCVAQINKYRATLHKSSLQKPSVDYRKCLNEKALSGLYYAEHKKKGCSRFPLSLDCGMKIGGLKAENSCCPRQCTSYDSCKKVLLGCLKEFWDERGKRQGWTAQTQHYLTMIGDHTKVGCGFGFDSHGKMLATQVFY